MRPKRIKGPLMIEDDDDRAPVSAEIPGKLESLLSSLPEDCKTNGFLRITKVCKAPLGGQVEPTMDIVSASHPDIMGKLMTIACKHGPGDYYMRPLNTDKKPIPNPPQIGMFAISTDQIDDFKREHPDALATAPLPASADLPSDDENVRVSQQRAINLERLVAARRREKIAQIALDRMEKEHPEDVETITALKESIAALKEDVDTAQGKAEEKAKTQVESAVVQVLQSQPKLTDLLAVATPIITALINRPAPLLPANNGNTEIFKAVIESNSRQTDLMMKSMQATLEGVKSSAESQMGAIREMIAAVMEDKRDGREMKTSGAIDLFMQGVTLAEGLKRGEEPTALVIFREIKNIVGPIAEQFLQARKEQLVVAAAKGPEAVAEETQTIEQLTQAEVKRQLAVRFGTPQPPALLQASAGMAPPIASGVAPAPPSFISPVEAVLAKLIEESHVTPLPTEPEWIGEAVDLLPERLLTAIYESDSVEAVIAALRQYAPPQAVDAAITAISANTATVIWFQTSIQQLAALCAPAEEEEEKEKGEER